MNELLFFITIVLCFLFTLAFYKFLGKKGLLVWIAISAIISNIETVKLVELFTLETSLGTVLYASTFLATDILNEKYGNNVAKKSIWYGFSAMLVMTLFMTIALLYNPSTNDFAHDSLETIFTFNIRITLGSLLAFIVSQLCDTYLYNMLKEKNTALWVRNNLSTMLSQILDTIIFVLVVYLGILPFNTMLNMMLFMYIFKFVIALIDTPFMYLSTKIKPRED